MQEPLTTPFSRNAVLLIIDVQNGFDSPTWGQRNNPDAEQNIARLLQSWRSSGRPVAHVQHLSTEPGSSLGIGTAGSAIKDLVRPLSTEPVFQKQVNSAFIGTNLEQWLREHDYQTIVVVGLTTPHCVSTTVRMAGNLGFRTCIVSDATAAFELIGHDGKRYDPELIHTISLVSLHDEFAHVIDTASLLAMLG